MSLATLFRATALCVLSCLATTPGSAAPLPQGTAFAGIITLSVDLSDAPKRIFRVRETIPATPGPLTLDYPEWIPGEHAPNGPIENVAGLVIHAGDSRLPWRRDPLDLHALHVDVPADATDVVLEFQFLSPMAGGNFGSGVSTTADLLALEFNQVAFYPAGYDTRRIPVQAEVTLPAGWRHATALSVAAAEGDRVRFQPIAFETLVDTPLVAGRHLRRVDLDPGARVPVHLTIVGDDPGSTAIDARQLAQHRALVRETYALFGARHYDRYEFLLTLSDRTAHFGLEHQRSSDNRLMSDFLLDPGTYTRVASLLPHEFVHSWNGKYRRPAGLATIDFNTPMQTDLLWVYEGLTDYWASVLSARAGLWSADTYRDALAATAAQMSTRAGRQWRSLQDTADAMPLMAWSPGWGNWRRGMDYYPEGELLWLDVDARIRELSGNRRSLDDFARRFFGASEGQWQDIDTYTFDDIIAALDALQPSDWAAFLRARLDATGDDLPEHGLERSGWELVYTDEPSSWTRHNDALAGGALDLATSIGLTLAGDGRVRDVRWGGPAFDAGMVPGMSVTAINGRSYSADALKDAIRHAARDPDAPPITLLLKYESVFSSVHIDYHGGLRYPHLRRIDDRRDRLADIIKPRAAR